MNWKDYSKHKPDRDGEYLVYDGTFVRVDTWYEKAQEWIDQSGYADQVTYWMPFPEPPTKKKKKAGPEGGWYLCHFCHKPVKNGEHCTCIDQGRSKGPNCEYNKETICSIEKEYCSNVKICPAGRV